VRQAAGPLATLSPEFRGPVCAPPMEGRQMAQYPLFNAFLTMMFFFIWLLWLYLLVWIIIDIFRSHDLSGWAKGGWLILVVVLPYIGVFAYVIARGGTMHERLGHRSST
jgi:hypothetical protein